MHSFSSPSVATDAPPPPTTDGGTCLTSALTTLTNQLKWATEKERPQSRGIALWLEHSANIRDSNLSHFIDWYSINDYHHIDGPLMQIHFSDWFKAMGISTPEEVVSLQKLWPRLTGAQRYDAVSRLVKIIDESKLTKAFSGDVSGWGDELRFIHKLGIEPENVQEFSTRWKSLSGDERKIFLMLTISDDLPGVLDTFVPMVRQGDSLVHVAAAKRVPIRIVSGVFQRRTIMVDERLANFASRVSLMDASEVEEAAHSLVTHLQDVTFDEIEYFDDVYPKKRMRGWFYNEHTFRSVDESVAISSAIDFAQQESKGGILYGRMGSYCWDVLTLVDHLDAPPTKEQYERLLKIITNGREQTELRYRLNERFPAAHF